MMTFCTFSLRFVCIHVGLLHYYQMVNVSISAHNNYNLMEYSRYFYFKPVSYLDIQILMVNKLDQLSNSFLIPLLQPKFVFFLFLQILTIKKNSFLVKLGKFSSIQNLEVHLTNFQEIEVHGPHRSPKQFLYR